MRFRQTDQKPVRLKYLLIVIHKKTGALLSLRCDITSEDTISDTEQVNN